MWTEILPDDKKSLQTVQDILLLAHPYYKLFTPDFLSEQYRFRRSERYKIHLYIDPDYEVCAIFKMTDSIHMYIVTGMVRAFRDMSVAADIFNKKCLSEMNSYGAKYSHGVPAKDCSDLMKQFADAIVSGGKASGLYGVIDNYADPLDPKDRVIEFLPVKPDDGVYSVATGEPVKDPEAVKS